MQPEQAPPRQQALLIWQRRTLLSRREIGQLAQLLAELQTALATERQLIWMDDEQEYRRRLLRSVGVFLLSEGALKRQRHRPKPGARPVVLAQFKTPANELRELYILDVQTRLSRRSLAPEAVARREAAGNPGRR